MRPRKHSEGGEVRHRQHVAGATHLFAAEAAIGGKHVLKDDVGRIHCQQRWMPCVSTKPTRTTSSFSSSIRAMICASRSWRSDESWPARAMKLARPRECSAAAEMFVLLASGGISDISDNAVVGVE